MQIIYQIFKGFIIGSGAILPGLSSGILCMVFGIYEKLLNSILGFFSNIKENIKFLLPISIGICFGIFAFSRLLKYVFIYYEVPSHFCFIGLILGSIPSIIKQTKAKKITLMHIVLFMLTFAISIYLVALEQSILKTGINSYTFASCFFAGLAMSCGIIIPGVSSTVILLLLRSL